MRGARLPLDVRARLAEPRPDLGDPVAFQNRVRSLGRQSEEALQQHAERLRALRRTKKRGVRSNPENPLWQGS